MFDYESSHIAGWTGGTQIGPNARVTGVSVDSRQVSAGDLFFALRGERVDGHMFLERAFAAGASAAVVARAKGELWRKPGLTSTAQRTLIQVDDPLAALGALAARHRARFHPRVVGVTGSLGKTTTKDLIAGVLSKSLRTLRSEGNFNTEIGVPLTLFNLTSAHQAAVVEMAMRGRGQIRELAQMADPEVGVITNIGLSHMELLGSQDAIAETKAELLEALPPTGTGIVNADDPYCEFLAGRALRSIRYGFAPEADIRCEGLAGRNGMTGGTPGEGAHFLWSAPAFGVEAASARIPLPGRHNVRNALAAIAVGLWMGLGVEEIAEGLASAEISGMRMELLRAPEGILILNDAYNASSPEAMLAALEVLGTEATGRRQVAVLGSMLELGPATESAHREVGEAAARPGGPDLLITVGEHARHIADAARDHGLLPEQVIACPDNAAAVDTLRRKLRPRDVVLVKGSRGIAMETVVQALLAEQSLAGTGPVR